MQKIIYRCQIDGIIHLGKTGNGFSRSNFGDFKTLIGVNISWLLTAFLKILLFRSCRQTRFYEKKNSITLGNRFSPGCLKCLTRIFPKFPRLEKPALSPFWGIGCPGIMREQNRTAIHFEIFLLQINYTWKVGIHFVLIHAVLSEEEHCSINTGVWSPVTQSITWRDKNKNILRKRRLKLVSF